MYPSELEEYISSRNHVLTQAETRYVTDTMLHPQIDHITYNPWDCSYSMWDNVVNYYHFKVKRE